MKRIDNKNGFTLVEVLISVVLLSSIFLGAMYSFIKCKELNDLSQNSSTATLAVRNKISEIEKTAFSSIYSTYDDQPFAYNGLNGIGVTYVDNSNPELLEVKAVFCWQEGNGRILGEDSNLNGQLDSGEDSNGNGEIDSLAQLTTHIENL